MKFKYAFRLFIFLGCTGLLCGALSASGFLSLGKKNPPFTVAFYNLENLFDTEDDPRTDDAEFLPSGSNAWTAERCSTKMVNMAKVIATLGDADGPEIIGLAEVENRGVLEKLISQPSVKKQAYRIVHYDSPDERGIDVALLYKASSFTPVHSHPVPVHFANKPQDKTRDLLYVKGTPKKGGTLHILVNHWPSRRGGQEQSEPFRREAAKAAAAVIDSVLKAEPGAAILLMGDLNDDPGDKSVTEVLGASATPGTAKLFNPMAGLFEGRKQGTLSYKGNWNLFDQLIMSQGLLGETGLHYVKGSAGIWHPVWMTVEEGKSQGVPRRTFNGGKWYADGYSDHFPVYLQLAW